MGSDDIRNRPRAICIMGPTASGKTELAVQLAQRFPLSIISVDSALVYRGMDIGTAKPGADILRIAPHRLIDICDPAEAYSAARFREDALREMRAALAIGKVPMLVGGTMLYFRALERGLADLPPADPEVRARLETERKLRGVGAMHERLAVVDPAAAARIHAQDAQRIQRALEVYELTGKPITELYRHRQAQRCSFDFLKIVISIRDRHSLHKAIERRFSLMLERGFVGEVERLRARGDLSLDKPAMRSVGYRQIWDYLEGHLDYSRMVHRGVVATRQLAKRQLTWLRSEAGAEWLDSKHPGRLGRALELLRAARFFRASA